MKPIRYPSLILGLFVMALLGVIGSARGQTPQIASLLPTLGPAAGGTSVIIVGAGFQSGATVSFGPLPVPSVVLTPNAISVVTPAAAGLGTVDVSVSNTNGQSATLTNGFSYACVTGENFNPVPLTPESYAFGIVVPVSYPVLPANAAVNVTMDGGPNKNGNTWYEAGTDLSAPATGLPPAGSLLVDQSQPDHLFVLAPTWVGSNCLFIGNYPAAGLAAGSLTPTTPVACTNLSFLNSSGNGPANLMCIITHADGTTETSSFVSLDWFNGASAAFSAQGRLSLNGNGGFNNVNSPNGCKLFSTDVPLANTNSPVTEISFMWVSGGRAAFFAVSGNSGAGYAPIAVTGYNADVVVEATQLPLPYTATMDNGTNIANGGGNTWYELGWDPLAPATGFPPQGSLLVAPFTGTPYQMAASYASPMAILIDASHPTANLTPVNPQACTAFSLLTSGGSIGVNRLMANLCVMEHADGTTETNSFIQYDWFQNTIPAAYSASGRVNFSNGRVLNNVNGPDPVLFETQLPVVNVASPVTNIVLQFLQAPAASSTTYLVALSASATEKPTITCPANINVGCSMDLLVPVNFSASATDNCDPNPTLNYSIAPGSGFPVGTTSVTATARNASGVESSCTFTVARAALGFAGFKPPLGGADASGGSFGNPLRAFKLNSAIPVKFAAACAGSRIVSGRHRLEVIPYTNPGTAGPAIAAVSKDAATTGDQFRLTGGEWHFNLDTRATGMRAGIWLLRATLSDGSQHSVWIQIK